MKIILAQIWLLAVINRSIGTDDRKGTGDLPSVEGGTSSDLEEQSAHEYQEQEDVSAGLKGANPSTNHNISSRSQNEIGKGDREPINMDRNFILAARNMLKSKVYKIMCTPLVLGPMTPHRFQICKNIICDIELSKNKRSSPTCSELARPETKRSKRSPQYESRQHTIQDADIANDTIVNEKNGTPNEKLPVAKTKKCQQLCQNKNDELMHKQCKLEGCLHDDLAHENNHCPSTCKTPKLVLIAELCLEFGCKPDGSLQDVVTENLSNIVHERVCPDTCKSPMIEEISIICEGFGCYPNNTKQNNNKSLSPQNIEPTPKAYPLPCVLPGLDSEPSLEGLTQTSHILSKNFSFTHANTFYQEISETRIVKHGGCPAWCKYPGEISQFKMCLSFGCMLSSEKTVFGTRYCSKFCHPPISYSAAILCQANRCSTGGHKQDFFFEDILEPQGICPSWCKYPEGFSQLKKCLSFGCKLLGSQKPIRPENTEFGSRFCLESCRPPVPNSIAILCAVNHCNMEGLTQGAIYNDVSKTKVICPKWCMYPGDAIKLKACLSFGCKLIGTHTDVVLPKSPQFLDRNTPLSQEQTFLGNTFCLESCHPPVSYSVALLCKANHCSNGGTEQDLFFNDILDTHAICPKWCKYPGGVLRLKMCLSLGCKLIGTNTNIVTPISPENTAFGSGFCLESCHSQVPGGPLQESFNKDITENKECPKWCKYPGDVSKLKICLSFGCKLVGSKTSMVTLLSQAETLFGTGFCSELCHPPISDLMTVICNANRCNMVGPSQEAFFEDISENNECPQWCKYPGDISQMKMCLSIGCKSVVTNTDIGKPTNPENTEFGIQFCLESCRLPVPDSMAFLCDNHCKMEGHKPETVKHEFSECPEYCKNAKDVSETQLCVEYGCNEEQRGTQEVLDQKSEEIIECPVICEDVKDDLIMIQCMLIGCSNSRLSKNPR